tara:strand:- start:161 stop:310 length:150 start_codon:yes stop_codon:yes gene_type:complete
LHNKAHPNLPKGKEFLLGCKNIVNYFFFTYLLANLLNFPFGELKGAFIL